MPYVNLGNLVVPSNGASLYTYKYNFGTKTHEFNGMGQFGFSQCLRDWEKTNKIKINDIEIVEVNKPEKIKAYAWITFIIENNKMYIFDKTSTLIQHINGEIITPINDINIWCACADIDWSAIGSPDINILLSSTYAQTLFENKNSFAYFKRSNIIWKEALNNNTSIQYLENKKYYTSPYMTSTSNPPGYFTSTSMACNTDYKAHGAFSKEKGYLTESSVNADYQWCQLQIPSPIIPYKMTIIPNGTDYQHKDGELLWQASSDGSNWKTLDTKSLLPESLMVFYNKLGTVEKYSYFRITLAHSSTKQYWYVFQGQVHGFL